MCPSEARRSIQFLGGGRQLFKQPKIQMTRKASTERGLSVSLKRSSSTDIKIREWLSEGVQAQLPSGFIGACLDARANVSRI